MTVFGFDSTKLLFKGIGKTIRETMGCLALLGGLIYLTGCPNPDGGKAKPTTPTVAPPVTTPGKADEPKIFVGEPPFSVTFNENGPETLVTLPYTSQGGAIPTSCTMGTLVKVEVTKSCACSEGVCRVGIKPTPKIFGSGSFEFLLSGQNGVSSNDGKASVEVLEVTLSLSSGDGQTGTVGTNLPKPIVVLVQNSKNGPVPGVDIFWNVKKLKFYGLAPSDSEQEGWSAKVSSCTKRTDNNGLAQCIWTLGTKIPVSLSQAVNVTAFEAEAYKSTLGGSFSAIVKPTEAKYLAFRNQAYGSSYGSGNDGVYSPRVGFAPGALKKEKAGVALGGDEDTDDPSYEVQVYIQDKYGNATTINGETDVTLSLKEKPAEDAAFLGSGPPKSKMKNEVLELDGYRWTQSLARFKNVRLNKAGAYRLSAAATDANLKASWLKDDFAAGFTVGPGDPSQLVFTTPPAGGIAEVVWDQPPVVAVQDIYNNVVTSSKAGISLAATLVSGETGGTLSGKTALFASGGVGTFSGLFISKKGNYKLTASSGRLPPATATFDISPNVLRGVLPEATTPPVFFNENGSAQQITLNSTPLPGGATACEVGSLLLMTVTRPCACTGGVCSVEVQPRSRSIGDGSFYFSLLGGDGAVLKTGKIGVEILGLTISISSGDAQSGTVGDELPGPIEVLVKNSRGENVPGVKVYWEIEKKAYKTDDFFFTVPDDWYGKISCTGDVGGKGITTTNNLGRAQCTWKLGTKILHGVSTHKIKVSAIHKFEENHKDTLVGSFSATVNPGPAALLSFSSQNFYDGAGVLAIYSGPIDPMSGKEKPGTPLGGKNGYLEVYAQDQYGNATAIGAEGVKVTLNIDKKKPAGALLSGTVEKTTSIKSLTTRRYDTDGIRMKWTWQGLTAKFDDIKVNMEGDYTLTATASDVNINKLEKDFSVSK